MSNQSTTSRRTARKIQQNKQKEHIIPICMDGEVDSTTDLNKIEEMEKSTSSDESTHNQDLNVPDNSSNKTSLCESVNQLNVSSDIEEISQDLTETVVLPVRMLGPYNVQEKIIIVFDCAKDEISTCFQVKGNSFTPADMIKRSLRIFLHNKYTINPKHQYALVFINENSTKWVKDFTSNIWDILSCLEDTQVCDTEDIFSLNNLFDIIDRKVNLDNFKDNLNIPPKYIVRTIFIYGRSFTMPELTETDTIHKILDSPYFTFDVLMTHEPPSAINHCHKIFKMLQNIDTKGFAYFFPVARNALDLHIAMAKLLSHPLQRPCQNVADYSINLELLNK